jgi:uncharacterized protein YggE
MNRVERDTITIVGAGKAAGVPDVLRTSYQITARGADVGIALDAAGEAIRRVLDVVRAHGVADRDIATGQIHVDERRGDKGQRLGFQAYQSLLVTTRDISRSGELMRNVAEAASEELSIGYISMAIDEPEPLLVAAREAAFADAKDKAEQLAQLAGRRLGTVLRIADDSGYNVYPRAARKGLVATTMSAVPIEAGEDELEARIRVTWQLTD